MLFRYLQEIDLPFFPAILGFFLFSFFSCLQFPLFYFIFFLRLYVFAFFYEHHFSIYVHLHFYFFFIFLTLFLILFLVLLFSYSIIIYFLLILFLFSLFCPSLSLSSPISSSLPPSSSLYALFSSFPLHSIYTVFFFSLFSPLTLLSRPFFPQSPVSLFLPLSVQLCSRRSFPREAVTRWPLSREEVRRSLSSQPSSPALLKLPCIPLPLTLTGTDPKRPGLT